jgi:ligand-binding sensor domain-containing protein
MFPGRDGKLWFSIKNALAAYDSQHWVSHIKLSEALGSDSSVSIRAGLQDSERRVWLATSEGIVRFDERKQKCDILDPFQEKAEAGDDFEYSIYARMMIARGIYHIYEDRRGRIWWAATAGPVNPILVYDKGNGSWSHYELGKHLPAGLRADGNIGLTVMYQDKDGRMMFGTSVGLLTFTETENKWELFTPHNSGLPDALIICIFEDQAGRIWLGTGKGIVVLEQ